MLAFFEIVITFANESVHTISKVQNLDIDIWIGIASEQLFRICVFLSSLLKRECIRE